MKRFQLRKDENLFQDEHTGAWVAEVENYPGCFPHWARIGVHNSRVGAEATILASRTVDDDCGD